MDGMAAFFIPDGKGGVFDAKTAEIIHGEQRLIVQREQGFSSLTARRVHEVQRRVRATREVLIDRVGDRPREPSGSLAGRGVIIMIFEAVTDRAKTVYMVVTDHGALLPIEAREVVSVKLFAELEPSRPVA